MRRDELLAHLHKQFEHLATYEQEIRSKPMLKAIDDEEVVINTGDEDWVQSIIDMIEAEEWSYFLDVTELYMNPQTSEREQVVDWGDEYENEFAVPSYRTRSQVVTAIGDRHYEDYMLWMMRGFGTTYYRGFRDKNAAMIWKLRQY